MIRVRRALLSVSDKKGIVEFAAGLERLGVEIVSTGGTLAILKRHRVRAVPIADYTGFPEILEGRVKTLHPKIHGGILHRREKKSHLTEIRRHGIEPIDMVVVNLYPFEETTRGGRVSLERAVEEIDIGGPAMLRAAAKNFNAVAVVSDPADYEPVLEEMRRRRGKVAEETLYRLACKVFVLSSRYDAVIASFLQGRNGGGRLPDTMTLACRKTLTLRYGENPHQQAALYQDSSRGPSLAFRCLHGKELSFNNLVDLEAAWDCVEEFDEPASCVIKHNNPCGIAAAREMAEAVAQAIDCDPESSFGGIIGLNRPCDRKTAEAILSRLPFLEVVVSQAFAKEALERLATRKNLRIVETSFLRPEPLDLRFSKLGLLVQECDPPLKNGWKAFRGQARQAAGPKLAEEAMRGLFFAWRAAKHVRSNAIVLTQGTRTVGIGAGQMSRVDAVKIACRKAGPRALGSFLGSDGFFPMPDSLEEAAAHGVKAVVQPGGSIRDQEVIEAAERLGLSMVFTGRRHFRH